MEADTPKKNLEASTWPSAMPGPGTTMPPTRMISQPALSLASSIPPESQRKSAQSWNASRSTPPAHHNRLPIKTVYGAIPPATRVMPTGSAPQKPSVAGLVNSSFTAAG